MRQKLYHKIQLYKATPFFLNQNLEPANTFLLQSELLYHVLIFKGM